MIFLNYLLLFPPHPIRETIEGYREKKRRIFFLLLMFFWFFSFINLSFFRAFSLAFRPAVQYTAKQYTCAQRITQRSDKQHFYLRNAMVKPYLMDSLSGYLMASVSATPFISLRLALSCVFRSSYCLLIAL